MTAAGTAVVVAAVTTTATAQRGEITAKAAMRELPDNLQSLAADMDVPQGCPGVPLVANVETVWTRKGDAAPRRGRTPRPTPRTSSGAATPELKSRSSLNIRGLRIFRYYLLTQNK